MARLDNSNEIAVVGGGPAGLLAALAIAQTGAELVLIAPPAQRDPRTTALLGGSVDILRGIGVWEILAPNTAPLKKLRLVDGTKRLIRTPEVLFDSADLELEAFGYNIENENLLGVLRDAIKERVEHSFGRKCGRKYHAKRSQCNARACKRRHDFIRTGGCS